MKRSRCLALFMLAAVAVSACGGGGSKGGGATSTGTPGGAAGSGASAPGVTATSVKVGGVAYKALYGDMMVGVAARFAAQNAGGGVYGRKINLTTLIDDGGSSLATVNAAHTLVEQDGVFAVLPVGDNAFTAANYLAQKQVPFFGWSVDPLWCHNQYGFGIDGNDCNEITQPTVAALTTPPLLFPDHSAKGKNIALVSEDNASAKDALKLFAKQWQGMGANVVLVDNSIPTPPAVVSDYTPFADKIMSAAGGKAPDYVGEVLTVPDTIGLQNKLVALGYHGILQNFTLYDPRLAKAAAGSTVELEFSPFEANIPGVHTMIDQIKAYAPGQVLDQPAETGWLSADEFIDGLKLAGPRLTRASFVAALNGGKFTPTFQGVAGPEHFPAAHNGVGNCVSFVRSDGTNYSVAVPLTCAKSQPNPLLGG